MRYVRMLLLHFDLALVSRSRSFIWFLITLINPLIYLTFWRGALTAGSASPIGWSLSSVASYYLLLVIAGAFLSVHIEEVVAYYDIQQGWLSNYLTRPFSYFWFKFFHEIPYRVIQGSFGLVVFVLFRLVYGNFVQITSVPEIIIMSIVITVMAYFISFIFKMIVGLSALWTTDFSGLSQLVGVVLLLFGGFIIPLDFFPDSLKAILYLLPFPYMFYFPIMAFQGLLAPGELYRVMVSQGIWLVILWVLYTRAWRSGVRLFTGVGR